MVYLYMVAAGEKGLGGGGGYTGLSLPSAREIRIFRSKPITRATGSDGEQNNAYLTTTALPVDLCYLYRSTVR